MIKLLWSLNQVQWIATRVLVFNKNSHGHFLIALSGQRILLLLNWKLVTTAVYWRVASITRKKQSDSLCVRCSEEYLSIKRRARIYCHRIYAMDFLSFLEFFFSKPQKVTTNKFWLSKQRHILKYYHTSCLHHIFHNQSLKQKQKWKLCMNMYRRWPLSSQPPNTARRVSPLFSASMPILSSQDGRRISLARD